jgi:hypothetical protein
VPSDDHPARDEQMPDTPGAAVSSQARRARAVVDFRPYPTAPTRTRRSPANSGRRHTRRGDHPTPSTIWFTPTRHEAGSVIADPPCLSGRGGAPETEPAGAVWPLSVLARAVTSFTEPGATVLLVPWPAAARDGLGEPVPPGAVAAVAEVGRRPRTAELPDGAARTDAVGSQSDVADDRVDLLITVMPARHDAAEHTDTVARLAARTLRLGGVLAVLTHCDRSNGVLIDPSGPMVTAGQNADLLYLQHVVAVHLPPAHLRPHPAHRADGRTPVAHRRVHSDVLVFAQPHDDGARPATARSTRP